MSIIDGSGVPQEARKEEMKQMNLADRFWSKVENASGADCWQWLGATDANGYGLFSAKRNGKHGMVLAHRVAWGMRYGPIPEGMEVIHACVNPGCCNPGHLKIDTHDGNVEDMVCKGRQAKGEKNGRHKLTSNDIPYIRLLVAAGASRCLVANRYNIHEMHIGAIVRGRYWRESEDDLRSIEEYLAAMFAEAGSGDDAQPSATDRLLSLPAIITLEPAANTVLATTWAAHRPFFCCCA
jgi:hypothetical protein